MLLYNLIKTIFGLHLSLLVMKKIVLSAAFISLTVFASIGNPVSEISNSTVIEIESLQQGDSKKQSPNYSKIISVSINDNKINLERGIPANTTGKIKVTIEGVEKLEKLYENQDIQIDLVHVRVDKPTQPVQRISIDNAKEGILFKTITKDAQPGDRLIIEIRNSKKVELISIPLQ